MTHTHTQTNNFIYIEAASLACAARLANAVRSLGAALRAFQ